MGEDISPLAGALETPSAKPDLQLHVRLQAAAPEERFALTGSLQALGGWNPGGGVRLECQGGRWVAVQPAPLSPGGRAEFKFVCLRPDGVEWEEGPNRVLEVPLGDADIDLKGRFNGDFVVRLVEPDRNSPAHTANSWRMRYEEASRVLAAQQRSIAATREEQRLARERRAAVVAQLRRELEDAQQELHSAEEVPLSDVSSPTRSSGHVREVLPGLPLLTGLPPPSGQLAWASQSHGSSHGPSPGPSSGASPGPSPGSLEFPAAPVGPVASATPTSAVPLGAAAAVVTPINAVAAAAAPACTASGVTTGTSPAGSTQTSPRFETGFGYGGGYSASGPRSKLAPARRWQRPSGGGAGGCPRPRYDRGSSELASGLSTASSSAASEPVLMQEELLRTHVHSGTIGPLVGPAAGTQPPLVASREVLAAFRTARERYAELRTAVDTGP